MRQSGKRAIRSALQEQITEILANTMNKEIEDIDRNVVNKIIRKINELQDLFYNGVSINDSDYYSSAKGWATELRRIKNVDNYTTALHLITEILDLFRGADLELEVYKTQTIDGKRVISEVYKGKEKETTLERVEGNLKKNISDSVHYVRDSLKKQRKIEEAMSNHYDLFYKTANKYRFKKEGNQNYNFNEGNIMEAFLLHLTRSEHKDFNNNMEFTPQHVLIMLYYATRKEGWWTGGDIGLRQIKLINNERLASQKSIRHVANVFIDWASNPMAKGKKMTPQRFNKLFSQDVTNIDDLIDLTEEEILNKSFMANFKATGNVTMFVEKN